MLSASEAKLDKPHSTIAFYFNLRRCPKDAVVARLVAEVAGLKESGSAEVVARETAAADAEATTAQLAALKVAVAETEAAAGAAATREVTAAKAAVRPGRYCSPRHGMPVNSCNEDLKRIVRRGPDKPKGMFA